MQPMLGSRICLPPLLALTLPFMQVVRLKALAPIKEDLRLRAPHPAMALARVLARDLMVVDRAQARELVVRAPMAAAARV